MQHWLGSLFVCISALCFGTLPILTRLAYDAGASPLTVLFLRFAIAAICLIVFMQLNGIPFPRGRTLVGLVLIGAVGYVLESLAYFIALTFASASLVTILFYLYPAIVTVLATMFLKEPIRSHRIIAVGLALIGATLTINFDGSGHLLGIVLSLASAVLYALNLVVGSQLVKKVTAIASSTIVFTSAAIVFAGLVVRQGLQPPTTSFGWLAICAIAFMSVLSIAFLYSGLQYISPAHASTLSTLELVATLVLAALVLRERMTLQQVIGGAFILLAVMISTQDKSTS